MGMNDVLNYIIAALAIGVCFAIGLKMGNSSAKRHKERRSGKK